MAHHAAPRTGRPPVVAARGMVTAPHYLASEAGNAALRRGGSAVDAAITANAVLAVAYPHMAGLGGDCFMLIAGGAVQGVEALEANGPAAAAATREFYRDHADIPVRGPLSALTVPGAVDGWRLAHERYGRLPWSALFDDAIALAEDGVAVSRSLADWIAADWDLLRADARIAEVFASGEQPLREGAVLRQSALAVTLRALASGGARGYFYEGEFAQRFARALEEQGCPLRADDFAGYTARWVEPISTTYRGREVFQLPPATQGMAALQILNLLEGFDLASIPEGGADYYHLLVEAVKVAFADRDEWLSDPAHVEIPLRTLLSKEYAEERRALIDLTRALDGSAVEPGLRRGDDAQRRTASGDTSYFAAADSDGMVVSIIQSPYHDFGAGIIAGDTGVIPQNRGSFFSLDPAHPNTLEPGKRTFHTIIPALVMEDGKPLLAYGTMGGEGQPQTQAAVLTRILDYGYDVQQALEAPRWLYGRTWGEDSSDLKLEARIDSGTVRELRLRGQPVAIAPAWDGSLGHAAAILVNRETGMYEGGADPRGDGQAVGH
ncbi:gamma-glutamyltransferase [Brevibacterium salitolerans]|uniref:Glutathione hydrolase proenzyme n=1 Tax=Brevibacterium salitolerans TaxID=1403566 RepID=A0ABN2X590_9MICO